MQLLPKAAWMIAVCAPLALAGCGPEGDPVACTTDGDCAAGQVCADDACATACTAGSCTAGVCDTASGHCLGCLTTDDCAADEVCNAFLGVCTPAVSDCTDDAGCDGARCDLTKGVCVGCLSDADCGAGTCDLNAHACVDDVTCTSDAQCAGARCETAQGVCVECLEAADCAGAPCDLVTHTCVAACVDDDASEPNTGAQAVALLSGGSHEGRICEDDVDAFTVDVADAVQASLSGAQGLTLELFDPAGGHVADGVTVGSIVSIDAEGLTAGRYRLDVRGGTSTAVSDYLLTVDAPAACVQLDSEPNGTFATGVAIAPDDALHAGSLCGDDVDFWRFSVLAGDDLTAGVAITQGGGTVALSLVDDGGAVLATGASLALNDLAAGDYALRVSGASGVRYTVRTRASASPPVCTNADAEPNDGADSALVLLPGVVHAGTICAADVDMFSFAAQSLDDARVQLVGAGVTAQLVRSADGQVLGSGTDFTTANLAAGGYRVVVTGTAGTTNAPYTVQVTLTPEPVDNPCTEGGAEPDGFAAPRTLGVDGSPLPGRICADDDDFFRFTLDFAATVRVSVRFAHAQGDLDILMLDATGSLVESSASETDTEVITVPLAAGTYTVQVYGYEGAVNTYSVDVSLRGCSPDDGFESNNSLLTAVPIGPGALAAVRCPADDDFFALRLVDQDALHVELQGAGLALSLLGADGSTLANGTGAAPQVIDAAGLPAGRYTVRVTGGDSARVPYTLTPSITPVTARCIDDGAAPNADAAGAFLLGGADLADGSYSVPALIICDGDVSEEFFALDLPGPKQVTVKLGFPADVDIDVEVLEARGTSGLTRSLGRATSTTVQDTVTGVLLASQRALLRVREYSVVPSTRYSIGVEVSAPPAVACQNDRFDTFTATVDEGTGSTAFHNDAAIDATFVENSETFSDLRICAGDADWLRVPVAVGQTLTATVTYAHSAAGDVDVRLYGPLDQTNAVDVSEGTTGTEVVSATAGVAGDHFVQVFGYATSANGYSITLTTTP